VEFPNVNPYFDENEVLNMAKEYSEKITALKPAAVLCQGEFSLSYLVTSILLKRGITVLCACSERKTAEKKLENGNIEKNLIFDFIRFRKYTEV
jgi:hypothetical protein